MEAVVKGKTRKRNEDEASGHPLDRKFSTMQEAAKAKTDWVIASKTPEEWEQLRRLMGK